MKKVISVFFSGTGFSIHEPRFLASQLYALCVDDESQARFGFNGCGVDYGFNGTLWGTGLDIQCQKVISQVQKELGDGHEVSLNVYGHSRGGIAALMLAKQLGQLDPAQLSVNLAMLDPVPGNFISTSSSDFFNISLANKTMDLSDCKTLKSVLSLYPFTPLPDIACHAPLFPTYPKQAQVDVDVTFGCHAGAEQIYSPDCSLVAKRFYDFLRSKGTQFYEAELSKIFTISDEAYMNAYTNRMSEIEGTTTRSAHSLHSDYIEVNEATQRLQQYFNRHHQQLAGVNDDPATRLASVKTSQGLLARLIAVLNNHPLSISAIQWGVIGSGLAASLIFTGGLTVIPFLATIVSNIGFIGTAIILSGVSAFTWQYALKPALNWVAERFYYPHYEVLHTVPSDANVSPNSISTSEMLDILGEPQAANKLPADELLSLSEAAYEMLINDVVQQSSHDETKIEEIDSPRSYKLN